jgi:hypothetical protein
MSITYTYEIISVNESARCMEVVYSAEGHKTLHIGARLPFEGESLEAVIKMYAPLPYWHEAKRNVAPPQVGTSGQLQEIVITESPVTSEDQFTNVFSTPPDGVVETTTLG